MFAYYILHIVSFITSERFNIICGAVKINLQLDRETSALCLHSVCDLINSVVSSILSGKNADHFDTRAVAVAGATPSLS